MSADYSRLPADLPVPVDDGAADGLVGTAVPDLALPPDQDAGEVLAWLGAHATEEEARR